MVYNEAVGQIVFFFLLCGILFLSISAAFVLYVTLNDTEPFNAMNEISPL